MLSLVLPRWEPSPPPGAAPEKGRWTSARLWRRERPLEGVCWGDGDRDRQNLIVPTTTDLEIESPLSKWSRPDPVDEHGAGMSSGDPLGNIPADAGSVESPLQLGKTPERADPCFMEMFTDRKLRNY